MKKKCTPRQNPGYAYADSYGLAIPLWMSVVYIYSWTVSADEISLPEKSWERKTRISRRKHDGDICNGSARNRSLLVTIENKRLFRDRIGRRAPHWSLAIRVSGSTVVCAGRYHVRSLSTDSVQYAASVCVRHAGRLLFLAVVRRY